MNDLSHRSSVSVVIPTLGREDILVDTLRHLLALQYSPSEILVIDQTATHLPATDAALANFERQGAIRWIRLPEPSITHAMNIGLLQAVSEIVLFVDDDIVPLGELVESHREAHDDESVAAADRSIVAGRVLQPWHVDGSTPWDRLASTESGFVEEFIGCNFSVKREAAIRLGGFDERFVRVAYRYEAEFAARAHRAGLRIQFAPAAFIHHLKAQGGGTRSFGQHLRTFLPSHTVGLYYFLLRARPSNWRRDFLLGPLRAVTTRFHLRRPWWIPVMLCAQLLGACWAVAMAVAGPKLVSAGAGNRR